MYEPQLQSREWTHRRSTNGCLVDRAKWERRRSEAAELVRKRFLTLREAAEHFALPVEEIAVAH